MPVGTSQLRSMHSVTLELDRKADSGDTPAQAIAVKMGLSLVKTVAGQALGTATREVSAWAWLLFSFVVCV